MRDGVIHPNWMSKDSTDLHTQREWRVGGGGKGVFVDEDWSTRVGGRRPEDAAWGPETEPVGYERGRKGVAKNDSPELRNRQDCSAATGNRLAPTRMRRPRERGCGFGPPSAGGADQRGAGSAARGAGARGRLGAGVPPRRSAPSFPRAGRRREYRRPRCCGRRWRGCGSVLRRPCSPMASIERSNYDGRRRVDWRKRWLVTANW